MSTVSSSTLTASFFNPLSKWKANGKLNVTLGCDVGGSGFRIRLSNPNTATEFLDVPHFKAQTTNDCVNALKKIENLAISAIPEFQVRAAAMAVAGPIDKDEGSVVLTNWKGSAESRTLTLKHLPQKLFPLKNSVFLNDLEAGAYGIIASHLGGDLHKYFDPLFEKEEKGPIVSNTRTVILAAGSGLGIGIIETTPLLRVPYVLASELGHLQIPINMLKASNYETESKLIQFISDEMYKGSHAPEYEDIVSGRGIPVVYQFFNMKETGKKIPLKDINAGDIVEKAKGGDKSAHQTLLTHYQFLLRVSKSVATSLSCDSVLLALDNQVKNDWFVQKVKNELADEFFTFIRPDWVKNIRVYTQRKVQNFNLGGCAWLANSRSNA